MTNTTTLSSLVNSYNFKLSTLNRVLSERSSNGILGRSIDIGLWGTRWVKINNDPEFVDLDVVADKMLQAVKDLSKTYALIDLRNTQDPQLGTIDQLEAEAAAGLSCLEKVRELYVASEGDIFTRVMRAFSKAMDYILDPCGWSTGWRSIEERYDPAQGTVTFSSFSPFNMEWVLKTAAPVTINTPHVSARVRELKILGQLLRTNTASVEAVQTQFARLHPLYQAEIKERIRLMGGDGISLPLLSEAVQLMLGYHVESLFYAVLMDDRARRYRLSDDDIRHRFNRLSPASQQHIKKLMWEIGGGRDDPQFAAGQPDWAGDLLRAFLTPGIRQLLLAAAAECDAVRSSRAHYHSVGQYYSELMDVEDAISRP